MQTFEMARHINTPRAVAWAVLSDLDRWERHAPNLSKTEVVAGEAEGAVRRCYNNAGKGWTETCTLWQPGRLYVMEVDTSDYPYPMALMRGTFSVDDDERGSLVKLRFDYQFKHGALGRVAGALSRPVFGRTCKRVLDSIEREATAAAVEDVEPAPRRNGRRRLSHR